MCYLFLNYLLLGDFLNETVDMLKKIFKEMPTYSFFTVFRKSNAAL